MIHPKPEDVGKRVAYRDTYMKIKKVKPDYGVITAVYRDSRRGSGLFVRFDGDDEPVRCPRGNLEWVEPNGGDK